MTVIHRCGGCTATWTGLSACHCSAVDCHRTFTSLSAFDSHRRGGCCVDPADVGLVPANREWPGWSLPGTHPGGADAEDEA